MKIPISKIGKIQTIDIQNSSGIVFHDEVARICTVIKEHNAYDNRGDKFPYRAAKLFGGNWQDYNHHFIIQSAGCPLKCPYCYVDNLKADLFLTSDELIEKFIIFKKEAEIKFKIKLKVFHFMGGAPSAYCGFWPQLRNSLDKKGLKDVILFSDVIFVENYFFKNQPWKFFSLPNFIATGCLKGTNRKNFLKNTGCDLFEQAVNELQNYLSFRNFYLTLIAYDNKSLSKLYKIIPKEKIDFLNVINYEVTKNKKQQNQ